ncbi:MAG TPA: pyrimidine reductase family protein [Acidimicrobiales bacterium]|nr:pyrimidine reductase family protein [Acidimicrobiales bacterium]
MRSLFPEPGEDVDLVEAYSRDLPVPKGRPMVRVNMISTLDGATSYGGRSGPLGGPEDKLLFSVLRSLADVVLVGAGTARTEHYGPVRLPAEVQRRRQAKGQRPVPPIAIVTRSLSLDWGAALFGGGDPRPIVVAPVDSGAAALGTAGRSADLLTAGVGEVDLAAALASLAKRGMHHVLCEGGPGLNTGLTAAGLVDELCLTLSPKLAGDAGQGLLGGQLGDGGSPSATGEAGRTAGHRGRPFTRLLELRLTHVLEEDSFLFLRLRPSYSGGSPAT